MESLEFLHNPLTWVAIGVVLLIAESVSGEGSLLAFGISGLLVALVVWLTALWVGVLWLIVLFAVFGVIISVVTRRIMKNTEHYKDDINTF